MKRGLIALLAIAGFIACKKDKGDTINPVITVTSPNANQTFNPGQVVNIAGTVTDNDELHEIHVYVTNKANGSDVVHLHEHVDVKSYVIAQTFTAVPATTYKIKVEADDHSGNHSEIEFEVKGN